MDSGPASKALVSGDVVVVAAAVAMLHSTAAAVFDQQWMNQIIDTCSAAAAAAAVAVAVAAEVDTILPKMPRTNPLAVAVVAVLDFPCVSRTHRRQLQCPPFCLSRFLALKVRVLLFVSSGFLS